MPARLVYTPKAWVFTKDSAGVIRNLSPYVTSGEVQRLVNQASTAEVTLRNPKRMFTSNSVGIAFHPMDAITIYLGRLPAFPVQVFTGYLDDTPYYQLYPGTVTLQATCTLKRLLFTYFDPSLPYVNSFLQQFGWVNNNGTLTNLGALGNQKTVAQGSSKALQDGSIGKLLWATLTDIGEWQDSNIWIEDLPSGSNGIAARMAQLMAQLATDETEAASEFSEFMGAVIGSGSQGSGGGSGATSTGSGTITGTSLSDSQKKVAATLLSVGKNLKAPKAALLAVICASLGESNLGDDPTTYQPNSYGYWGVLQGGSGENGSSANFPPPNGAHDVTGMATAFFNGGKGFGNGPGANGRGAIALANSGMSDPGVIALAEEDSGEDPSYYGKFAGQAQDILNAFEGTSGSTKANVTNAPNSQQLNTAIQTEVSSSKSKPGGIIGSVVGAAGADGTAVAGGKATGQSGQMTRLQAIIEAASEISAKSYPYISGGGHAAAGTPSNGGFDFTGAVAAVLSAAGYLKPGSSTGSDSDIISTLKKANLIAPGPGTGGSEVTLYDKPGHQVFMRINGKFWGASQEGGSAGSSQAWSVLAGAEDDPPGTSASCGPLPSDRRGYSVLSMTGTSSDSGTAGQALSAGSLWPCSAKLIVTASNGRSVTISHVDNGAGSDSYHPIIGLYPQTRADLGLSGGPWTVTIQAAGGSPEPHPVRGTQTNGGSGGEWISNHDTSGFQAYHLLPNTLGQITTFTLSLPAGSGGSGGGSAASSSSTGSVASNSNAEAFTAEIDFPSIQDMTTAIMLGAAHKGLMHDQQLLPFVQQLTQASLRSFQSLPNGDFFAFYPDYFGETDHHKPYWNIDDIEILDGTIYLNDQSLVTHEYAVGDNTYPINDELINELFSAGSISVFNAFLSTTDSDALVTKSSKDQSGGMSDIMSQTEAVEFIKRYGARPQVQSFPMVRSPLYEMFLAYQNFMLAWSNQFRTPFTFTFMPELFPGGKVAFPSHGLQMYVSAVTHSWDYGEGFTTTAVLSAPAAMAGVTNPDLPPNMVQALVEPVRAAAAKDPQTAASDPTSAQTTGGNLRGAGGKAEKSVAGDLNQTIQTILGGF